MTIGSILVGLGIFIFVGMVLARPFLSAPPKNHRVTRRRQLLIDKELLLDRLQSLDFDFETGKIPEDVFQKQRADLLAQTTAVLKQVDELKEKRRSLAQENGARVEDVDAKIEAAISQFRQKKKQTPPAKSTKTAHTHKKEGFCPECGHGFDAGDKFCVHCGHRLPVTQPA